MAVAVFDSKTYIREFLSHSRASRFTAPPETAPVYERLIYADYLNMVEDKNIDGMLEAIDTKDNEYLTLFKIAVKSIADPAAPVVEVAQSWVAVADKFPLDVLSLKRASQWTFSTPDFPLMLRITTKGYNHYLANKDKVEFGEFVPGIHAFSLQQNEILDVSEKIIRASLESFKADPWGIHALLHILYFAGKIDEGIEAYQQFKDYFVNCDAFLFTHARWHFGLFLMDKDGDEPRRHLVDSIIAKALWADLSDDFKKDFWVCTGVLALFWKIELRDESDALLHSSSRALLEQAFEQAFKFVNVSATYSEVYTAITMRYVCLFEPESATRALEWVSSVFKNDTLNNLCRAIVNHYLPDASLPYDENLLFNLDCLGSSSEQREVLFEFSLRFLQSRPHTIDLKKSSWNDALPRGT